MMIFLFYLYLRSAASVAHKLLNILALGRPFLSKSGRHRFAWAAVPYTTELTSISGLMTISPEGGP